MGVHSLRTSPGKRHLMKLLVERKLPGQEAAVERGQRELQVVRVEAACFLHRARAGAGPQADVPHPLDYRPHGLPGLLLGLVVGEGKEHVDVGVGEEILAAIAPHGQQGNVLRRQPGKGPPPHLDQDAIHDGRAPPDGSRTIPGALAGLAYKRHLLEILLPKIVNYQNDWIHEIVCVACRSKKELLQA